MATSTKNKLFIFIIALLLLSNIGLIIFYTGFNRKEQKEERGHGENPMLQVLKNEVGFNEDQIARYETMRQEHRSQMRPLFDSIRTAKEKLYNQLYQAEVNDSVFTAAMQEVGEKQQMLDSQLFNHFRNLRSLCTADQQPRFDTLINTMVKRMIVPGRRGGASKTKSTESEKSPANK